MLGAQQQQVVAGAKARLLEQTERTPPAGMLEPRLQREHLAHAERKAPRNRKARLRLARRPVARLEDRRKLMPVLGRRRLDDARDGSI